MSGPEELAAVQFGFARHLRDPERVPPPAGVEPRRLAVYRGLLYRNVEGFMARAFPVLRAMLDDGRWHALVRRYFAEHRAQTPLFPRMPQEFLRFLADTGDMDGYPPYLAELARYEWLEAEVLYDVREPGDVSCDAVTDLRRGAPVVNPTLRAQAYRWPVHRIGPDFRPQGRPGAPVYLAVYRKRDDSAGFMELNAVAARLLDLCRGQVEASGESLLLQVAAELGHDEPARVVAFGLDLLADFLARDLVLGTRRAASPRA